MADEVTGDADEDNKVGVAAAGAGIPAGDIGTAGDGGQDAVLLLTGSDSDGYDAAGSNRLPCCWTPVPGCCWTDPCPSDPLAMFPFEFSLASVLQ